MKMQEDVNVVGRVTSLKDLQEQRPYGEFLQQILQFYVPLALKLPSLRENKDFILEKK